MNSNALLGYEWQTLQNNHEQHEKSALLVKLTCMSLYLAGLVANVPLTWMCAVVTLCWIQEGIFKTFQSRLAERLLRVESLLRKIQQPPLCAMQLHTEWSASRQRGTSLIAEYAASTCRPTAAFPYVPLLLLLGLDKVLRLV